MALLDDEPAFPSPIKKKRREHAAGAAASPAVVAAASAGRTHAVYVSPPAAATEGAAAGRPALDGLLRVKKVHKHVGDNKELLSALAPLAAAGAAASSGAAGLLAPSSTIHLHSPQQQQQDESLAVFLQQQKGEVKVLENLLVRRRLHVLRSCLLRSPSPSLQSLVLQRLAAEAAAFPAAFSPFQLLSHRKACPATAAAKEDGGDFTVAAAGGDGGENEEGRAVVKFLCFLKEALEAAPTTAVSFDTEGRLCGRRTAVLLKHVEPAATAAATARQPKNSRQSSSSNDNSSANGSHHGSSSSNSDTGRRTCGSKSKSKGRSAVGSHGGPGGATKGGEHAEGAASDDWRKFTFQAPVEVHVVGSFPLNLTTCFSKNVDVCVMMPPHMFGRRDHLNYRYFNKRNAYTQVLYEHLRDLFAAAFSSPSAAATALPGLGSPGRRRAAGVPSSAGSAVPFASADTHRTPAVSASGRAFGPSGVYASAASDAFSRCAESAAAFRAAAPRVVPRVFLQAWQGCLEKPVVAIRFVMVKEHENEGVQHQKLLHAHLSKPKQPTSLVEEQEQLPLQSQLALQQWVVRVLAVPCPTAGPQAEDKEEEEEQHHGSSNTDQSSCREATGGSATKKASSSRSSRSSGDKRRPFPEHMLAVDRNCVREPTTCCRSLSFATPADARPADGSPAAEASAGIRRPQDTETVPPTPYYNMLLLEDLRLRQHQRLLYRCCRLYGDAFREAVLLLKVWALRRGFVAAEGACRAASVPAVAAAPSSIRPPPLRDHAAAEHTAEEETCWWKEATDVSGFLLAILCCHACLAAADNLTAPALAQQLLMLTFSFLAEADFLRYVYILGDGQPYPRQQDLKTLRAALLSSSHSAAAAATEEELTAGGDAVGIKRGRRMAPLFAASGTAAQTGATAEEGGERGDPAGLTVGLLDEAYLFDSPTCCFNLLWRAQLHVAELQQEARSSLQTMQRLADAYYLIFAPPSSVVPPDVAGRSAGDSSNISSTRSSSEHAQLYVLLQSDVQLYIPHVPQQPELYFPAAAYPLGNYLPYTLRQQPLRGEVAGAVAGSAGATAASAGGSSSTEVACLDALPKWESPQPALLGASILRLLVRGLGDRLRCYRVRVRRSCCPPAAATAAARGGSPVPTGLAAGVHAVENDAAMAGQPLAWTAKNAEAFLRGKRPLAATGLVISLELNAATAARLVERGPSAAICAPSATALTAATADANPAAAAEAVESFRLFWGPARVEVRRFHDAQTLFAVVWDRPSDEDQQLHALLVESSAPAAGASAADGADSKAGAQSARPLLAKRAATAAGLAGTAGRPPEQQQQHGLLVHPPSHTQVIRHLLRRHLPHLLELVAAEDPHAQQEHQQQSSISSWGGTHAAPSAKRRSSISKDSNTVSGAAASSRAALCYLASTPLGAVPSLSTRHKQLVQTFNELRNTICSLSSLPLAVKQIWHAGAALRFADASPLSAPNESDTEDEMVRGLHRVVVEFEDSAAWPEEAVAVRHVKIAFLLAMRKELLSDHGICGVVSPCCCLDVEVGLFTFRIIIFHPAEAAAAAALYAEPRWEPLYTYLRQRAIHTEFVASKNNSSSSTESNSRSGAAGSGTSSIRNTRKSKRKRGSGEEHMVKGDEAEVPAARQRQLCSLFNSIDAEDEDEVVANPFAAPLFARKHLSTAEQEEEEQRLCCLRCLWWKPQVAAVLHACALRYPPFAGCVRLAKRWVAEKQLPACMHLVEHVVTVVFVEAFKWGFATPPQSVHVAFIRFLHLVAGFDWEAEPFIVCFDPDVSLGVQREQLMKLSFEKFHRYPSVQSLFDPHGFIIPLPDAVAFTRFVRSARASLASIMRIPFCPYLGSKIWKSAFFFNEWSSMDFVLYLRKDFSVPEAKGSEKRYANDFRPSVLPACVASFSGEAGAVAQLLLRAATTYQQDLGAMRCTSQPGTRMLFSPSYVRRFLFLRFLRELLGSVWTGNEIAMCMSDPSVLGMRSVFSVAYNPLRGALQGGGMPAVIGFKLNTPRAYSGTFSLFLARSLQPSVTFPRCCFSIEIDREAEEVRKADVSGATDLKGERNTSAIRSEEGSKQVADCFQVVDCLNPVLLMAGLFAAGGELVESIQIGGC